jgi:hypothetical protein
MLLTLVVFQKGKETEPGAAFCKEKVVKAARIINKTPV